MNAAVLQADAVTNNKNLDVLKDREAITLRNILEKVTHLPVKVMNLSLAGAMVSDQYLITKALLAASHPKVVIIGLSPRAFLDNAMPAASATEPFHFFHRYVKLESLIKYSFSDPLSQANWLVQEYLPLRRLYDPLVLGLRHCILPQGCTVNNHAEDLTNKELGTQTTGQKIVEHKSRALLRTVYASTDEPAVGENIIYPVSLHGFIDNTREYARRYHDPAAPNYKQQNRFFKEYLSLLKSFGTQVVVLSMPALPANRCLLPEWFWREYRQQMKTECACYGATWVDLSSDKSFDKADFLDNVHLNADGGRLLIEHIAELIRANSSLLRALRLSR
jgi:lysophospholipase L1-like esterase